MTDTHSIENLARKVTALIAQVAALTAASNRLSARVVELETKAALTGEMVGVVETATTGSMHHVPWRLGNTLYCMVANPQQDHCPVCNLPSYKD